jgi:hypothetical protein
MSTQVQCEKLKPHLRTARSVNARLFFFSLYDPPTSGDAPEHFFCIETEILDQGLIWTASLEIFTVYMLHDVSSK